jgi:glycosyltransferase involved in cell wall biosynthesis
LLREPEKAKELLYLADIFVLPSLREGQAIVIYEAMQAGLPVIASALEGVKDIIINKENGLLVKPADVEELADNCELLYNNKELREELAKNGQQKVKSFTIENNVNTLTKLIIESYEATN